MYADSQPCSVCGSEVELRPREVDRTAPAGPVGPPDGVVGTGDPTVDVRVCTNADCATHTGDATP